MEKNTTQKSSCRFADWHQSTSMAHFQGGAKDSNETVGESTVVQSSLS